MMNKIQNETEVDGIQINKCLNVVCKSVCKIIAPNKISSGFLIKLYRGNNPFYCIMTNGHAITKEMIELKEAIEIYYDNANLRKEIKLDIEERYIRAYINLGIDALIIEILEKDNINEDYFLLPDSEYINGFEAYKNTEIYIPQYKEGDQLNYSRGKIKEINKYKFSHLSNSKKGTSGSPIFMDGRIKVIGINMQNGEDNSENYGCFIGPIIELLKKNIETYALMIHENGNYYIGQMVNGYANGKGTIYYNNGSILYDGDFINGKYEGNGRENYENGTHYIGQFLGGYRHGKGVMYYNNGSILYEGDFVNDIIEGNGKLIQKNGNYYIGQFLNGLAHGKGVMYYKNGSVLYEGDLVNDKFEGNGKEIYDNGNYYIGQFLNGFKHGKGTLYNKDGKILYKGKFANDNYSKCLVF